MALFALAVGEPPDSQEIRSFEKSNALAQIEADVAIQFLRDIEETGGGETGHIPSFRRQLRNAKDLNPH